MAVAVDDVDVEVLGAVIVLSGVFTHELNTVHDMQTKINRAIIFFMNFEPFCESVNLIKRPRDCRQGL